MMTHSPSSTCNLSRSPFPTFGRSITGLTLSKKNSRNSIEEKFIHQVRLRSCRKAVTVNVYGKGTEERLLEEEHLEMVETETSFRLFPGQAYPLGVSELENGINFSLFSRHATSVTLCLLLPEREERDGLSSGMVELKLDSEVNKTGDIWHICIEDLPRCEVQYGYRIDGPRGWHQGHRYDNNIILLDPYAKLVEGRHNFGDTSNKMAKFFGTYDFNSLPFNWGDNYTLPNIHEKDLVIYEMSIRAFTADESSGLDRSISGSYLGVIDKIPHLLELGINAVELLPVFEFDEFEFQRRPNPRDHMDLSMLLESLKKW